MEPLRGGSPAGFCSERIGLNTRSSRSTLATSTPPLVLTKHVEDVCLGAWHFVEGLLRVKVVLKGCSLTSIWGPEFMVMDVTLASHFSLVWEYLQSLFYISL